MPLIFGDGTARYSKFINVLPLSAKPTLCPALWHWIWTISSLAGGTMLSFVSRGSQRDINWIRGYLLSVSGCFVAFLGCLAARSLHLVALTLPAGFTGTPWGAFFLQLPQHPTGWLPSELPGCSSQLLSKPLWHPPRWGPAGLPQTVSAMSHSLTLLQGLDLSLSHGERGFLPSVFLACVLGGPRP